MESTIERELPDNQAGFRKARGTRDHIANMRWIMERQLEYGKEVHICFIDYSKAFDFSSPCPGPWGSGPCPCPGPWGSGPCPCPGPCGSDPCPYPGPCGLVLVLVFSPCKDLFPLFH